MRTRRLGTVLACTALVLLGCVVTPTSSLATDQPPLGAITRLGETFPNWYYEHRNDPRASTAPWDTSNVSAILDTTRNRVLSTDAYDCPWLVSQDMTTGAALAVDHPMDDASQCPMVPTQPAHSKSSPLVVDTTDGVLAYLTGVWDARFGAEPIHNDNAGYLVLASEDTLLPFAQVPLPEEPSLQFSSIRWYAASDQLILGSSNSSSAANAPGGVVLYSYAMKRLIAGGTQPEWTSVVPQCSALLPSYFARADVVRSSEGGSLSVPCQLLGATPSDGSGGFGPAKDGVVRLHLGAADALGRACGPDPCPDGGSVTAQAPGGSTDFLYDDRSDRGFFVYESGDSIDLVVYDGHAARFIGRSNVGGPEDLNNVAFGLDDNTGRIFAAGGAGLTVIEGRSTPVGPGDLYREYGASYQYVNLPVLPPDARHAYRRLLLPHVVSQPGVAQPVGYDFIVVADTRPVLGSSSPASIDANTHSGAVAPGSTTSVDYGGNAAGYGVHARWVGGPGGVIGNLTIGRATSPVSTDTDLLAGQVEHLRIRRGSADGSANPLGDGNGSTASVYQACSSGPTALGCVNAPGAPGAVAAQQPWAFADAQCSQPGAAADASGDSTGAQTSGGSPGGDGQAQAHVECAPDHAPAADSTLGAFSVAGAAGSAAAGLDLAVAQSHVEAAVTPPGQGGRTVAAVTAVARGVHVGLGALGGFDVGAVTQTATVAAGGTAGSASGSDTVTLDDVTLERDGTVETLCSGPCPDSAATLAKLNSLFAGVLELSLPPVDSRYAGGSPGGYIAAVQADLDEQYGDAQFNGMSPEEAALHPGVRLVVFGYADGSPSVSRQILDLAGVEADAELGLQVFAPFDAGSFAAVDQQAAAVAAGLPAGSAVVGVPPAVAALGASAAAPVLGGGLLGVVERAWAGFAWMWQSPAGAVQLALAFGLLGMPVAVARRRRTWMDTVQGGRR